MQFGSFAGTADGGLPDPVPQGCQSVILHGGMSPEETSLVHRLWPRWRLFTSFAPSMGYSVLEKRQLILLEDVVKVYSPKKPIWKVIGDLDAKYRAIRPDYVPPSVLPFEMSDPTRRMIANLYPDISGFRFLADCLGYSVIEKWRHILMEDTCFALKNSSTMVALPTHQPADHQRYSTENRTHFIPVDPSPRLPPFNGTVQPTLSTVDNTSRAGFDDLTMWPDLMERNSGDVIWCPSEVDSNRKRKNKESDDDEIDGPSDTLFPRGTGLHKKRRPGSPVGSLTTNKNIFENSKKGQLAGMDASSTETDHEVPKETLKRSIVRRSAIRSAKNHSLSINSKIVVNLEEITLGVTAAFHQNHKDLEALLDMKLEARFCSNFQLTMNHPRSLLANSFRTNFNFFMNRKKKDTRDYLEALGSQRCVSPFQYPHPDVLHTIIHQIVKNAIDHVVLYRVKELIYKTLSLHPPGDIKMRKYYWSIISSNFDDIDPFSRWEMVRCLLDQLLTGEKDIVYQNSPGLGKPPSPSERSKAVLGIIIHILNEDFRCWVMQLSITAQPADLLRDLNNLPLIARMLWPQKTIPHISPACRDLISFHLTALKSQPDVLWYTKPLVKMMASVTQLSDLQLPLRFRKPSLHMTHLAGEVLARSKKFSNSYASTFGSIELSLLLPLMAVNKTNSQFLIPDGMELNLTWMLNSFLNISKKTDQEAVAEFRSRPLAERQAFLSALSAYFKLFGSHGTWFYLRNKYRVSLSRVYYAPEQQPLKLTTPPIMFSKTFSSEQMMEDLRQTKRLLHSQRNQKSLYFYLSSVSWFTDL